MGFMIDTCIFNWLLDGDISRDQIPVRSRIFITHVQLDELNLTKCHIRRTELNRVLRKIRPKKVATESMVLGFSRLGGCKLSDDTLYLEMLNKLDALNKSKKNNPSDILIADTALKSGFTLITSDRHLQSVMIAYNGSVEFFSKPLKSNCKK
jgi:PIN domain nuclease of toxin-antitoxin system